MICFVVVSSFQSPAQGHHSAAALKVFILPGFWGPLSVSDLLLFAPHSVCFLGHRLSLDSLPHFVLDIFTLKYLTLLFLNDKKELGKKTTKMSYDIKKNKKKNRVMFRVSDRESLNPSFKFY